MERRWQPGTRKFPRDGDAHPPGQPSFISAHSEMEAVRRSCRAEMGDLLSGCETLFQAFVFGDDELEGGLALSDGLATGSRLKGLFFGDQCFAVRMSPGVRGGGDGRVW